MKWLYHKLHGGWFLLYISNGRSNATPVAVTPLTATHTVVSLFCVRLKQRGLCAERCSWIRVCCRADCISSLCWRLSDSEFAAFVPPTWDSECKHFCCCVITFIDCLFRPFQKWPAARHSLRQIRQLPSLSSSCRLLRWMDLRHLQLLRCLNRSSRIPPNVSVACCGGSGLVFQICYVCIITDRVEIICKWLYY